MKTTIDSAAWTGPITTTTRELMQLQEGHMAYLALGATAPADLTDGALIVEGAEFIFEIGQVYRIRTVSGTGTIYRGEFK
jgi:hypothetical protein